MIESGMMVGLSLVTGIFALVPLIMGYRLLKEHKKDPIMKSYKFAIIGVASIAIVELAEVFYAMGLLTGELAYMLIQFMDNFVFVFITAMITYGLYLTKKEVWTE